MSGWLKTVSASQTGSPKSRVPNTSPHHFCLHHLPLLSSHLRASNIESETKTRQQALPVLRIVVNAIKHSEVVGWCQSPSMNLVGSAWQTSRESTSWRLEICILRSIASTGPLSSWSEMGGHMMSGECPCSVFFLSHPPHQACFCLGHVCSKDSTKKKSWAVGTMRHRYHTTSVLRTKNHKKHRLGAKPQTIKCFKVQRDSNGHEHIENYTL